MFRRSARIYDAIYGDLDQRGHVDRINQMIQERKPGAKTLLDVACGTGLHLSHFRKLYDVEGLDLVPDMLEIARERLPGVEFHEADMADFDLQRKFDAVTCLFSSIGYARTKEKLDQSVANMARHLEPGGVLVVEPWIDPENWIVGHLAADFVDQPELKIARMVESRLIEEGAVSVLDMHHLVSTREGVEYYVETHELGMFTKDQYRAAFVKAGLEAEQDPIGLLGRGLWIASRGP